MRFRLDKHIRKVKWKYLISEILLIVIAINVGLWFNNLNDKRKEKSLEHKILNEFIVSLNSDKEDISSNLETHEKGIKSCERLIGLDKEQIQVSDFSLSSSWSFLVADLSSYESLKSIGIQLIKNDEIRRNLTKLYNVDYRQITELENNHKRLCYQFEKELGSLIDHSGSNFQLSDSIAMRIKQHQNLINNLKYSHRSMKTLYQDLVLKKVDALLAEIKEEVN